MNRKMLVILGIVFIAALCGGAYLLINGGRNATEDISLGSAEAQASQAISSFPAASSPGAYIDYSEAALASAQGTKLLFFHAPWCPQCRAIDEDIRVKGAPDGVSIIKVDYDSNQSLRKKYGVTLQTTVVRIDDNGNLIKKYVAYDEPSLSSIEKNLLK